MTIRVDDDLAAFVDRAVRSGEGSPAEVINRALRREVRRRAARRDAEVYATSQDPDLDADAYAGAMHRIASSTWDQFD